MRYVDVGTAKKMSKIGLGTWQFGAAEWGYGERYATREAHAIVRRALALGITLFDSAEIYGCGQSERILGRALGEDSESVVVATKMFPLVPSARLVRQRALASTNRLGVSRLDLYQAHWPNPLAPDSAIMRGMRGAQQAGLVAEVGVSNYSKERWRAAERALRGRVLSNQVEYSLVDRSPERTLLPFAESSGRVIIAFGPLAHGLLSGKYHGGHRPLNRARAGNRHFHADSLHRTSHLIAVLREIADAHRATPAQIALAWVIHQPTVAAIPGAATVAQLESNAAAAEIRLADSEYEALRTVSARLRPAAAPDASPRHRLPRLKDSAKFAVKHSAKGGLHVAKTVWRDYRLQRFPPDCGA